jgi:hypothetical protein
MKNVSLSVFGMSVLLLLEYLLFKQYYWVVGGKALFIWAFFVAFPSLLNFCFIYSYTRTVLSLITAIFLVSTSVVGWSLFSMHETWKDMKGLVGHLQSIQTQGKFFPQKLVDSRYNFRQKNSLSRIKFYLPQEDQAIVGFHVGDSSVAYSYSTKGGWSFDDD